MVSPPRDNEAATSSTEPHSATAHDHGGHLAGFRRLFPDAPEPVVDLSTGINPVPYPLPFLPPQAWTRLPEPEAVADLERAAATAYRLSDPAMAVAAPGSQLLISLLPHLLPHRRVAILGPTYAEHALAWRGVGATVREVDTPEALLGADIGIIGQPNNPDGRHIAPTLARTLAASLAARGGLLIVDEAFADFSPHISLAPELPHPGLLVLRSFGKAYGLAGLRLGFALAPTPLAEQVRRALGPWAVSGPALTIAAQALRDATWLARAGARLAADSERLDRLLAPYGRLGGTSQFRLLQTSTAQSLFARLGRSGIAVRRFRSRPEWLRFGLPADEAAWHRLDLVLNPTTRA